MIIRLLILILKLHSDVLISKNNKLHITFHAIPWTHNLPQNKWIQVHIVQDDLVRGGIGMGQETWDLIHLTDNIAVSP